MSDLPGAGADRALATPVVTSVVASLGGGAGAARAIRPWTHAGYTRWRRAALQALPVALPVGALLLTAAGQPAGRSAGIAALCWLATAWLIARRG